MTFNTQHCANFRTDQVDYDLMAKTIVDQGADIVGLNEMFGDGPLVDEFHQVAKLSEKTGLKYWYFAEALLICGHSPYGNGLLSRYPIVKAETVMVPDPEVKAYSELYETRAVLKATLENGLTVLVTHFGLNLDEHENAVQTVLNNLAPEKCVLMGDFNVTPDSALLLPIRDRMMDTADLFAEPLLSFPSDKPDRKIDYIFVSRDLTVTQADIPNVVASDHRPHTAVLEFA